MKVQTILLAGLLGAATLPAGAAEEADRSCLTAAETRTAVREHKLTDPGTAQRKATTQARAEALRTRLCRWNGDFVYEITLLGRDGKIMQVNVRAADGAIVTSRKDQ